jgi:hypothetical protein
MQAKHLPRRDTPAWIGQVWAAFAASVLLCGIGVVNIASKGNDRAFLTLAFFFCLSATITLAKTIRDNRFAQVDTRPWIMQAWAAFAIAIGTTAWGLMRLDVGVWERGFMISSGLFLISSAFVLAKTVRDNHEAEASAPVAANSAE